MNINPARVLIVDDNTDFSCILDAFLSQSDDIEVVGTAANGLEALRLVRALQPDIVLLDMILPQLDGLGVLGAIKDMNIDNKPLVIAMSALDNDMRTQSASDLGASAFFVKPFDLNALRDCILNMKE